MADQKTIPTDQRVEDFIRSRGSEDQQKDCAVLIKLLGKLTGEKPRMWGPSIVGFGSYKYRYESGRTGESCQSGFSIRGKKLVVYLIGEGPEQDVLLSKLGKHTMGKACLYFTRLSDLDLSVLEKLIRNSLTEIRTLHQSTEDE